MPNQKRKASCGWAAETALQNCILQKMNASKFSIKQIF